MGFYRRDERQDLVSKIETIVANILEDLANGCTLSIPIRSRRQRLPESYATVSSMNGVLSPNLPAFPGKTGPVAWRFGGVTSEACIVSRLIVS